MIPNFNAAALSRFLAQAIAVFPVGNTFLNLVTSAYTQVKTGLGIFSGLTVNTVGTTSVATLFDGLSSVVTMTIATPGVVTWAAHPFVAGGAIRFTTTGALPTGLTSGTTVYVSSAGLTADSFRVADTAAHAIAGTNTINTSGSQSGVQTGWDVSRPIGTFSTVAQGSLNNGGVQFNSGLIAVTSGGAPADLTVLYL